MRVFRKSGTERVIHLVRPQMQLGCNLDAFTPQLLKGWIILGDSAERAQQRREALHASISLKGRIKTLRNAGAKKSRMARQVELNFQIRRLEDEIKKGMGAF